MRSLLCSPLLLVAPLAASSIAQNHFAVQEGILQTSSTPFQQGTSIAIDGPRLIAGGIGAVIFRREATAWIEEQILTPPTGIQGLGLFGNGVALDGDRAAVAFRAQQALHENAPGVALYLRSNQGWELEDFVIGQAGSNPNNVGKLDVELEGDRVVVGFQDGQNDDGEVLVIERMGGTWQLMETLSANVPVPFAQLGTSVALLGDLIAAGQPLDDSTGSSEGSVLLWERLGTTWSQVFRVEPPAGTLNRFFGFSLALQNDPNGRLLVVGARSSEDTGLIHLFREQPTGDWLLEATLSPPNVLSSDQLGYAVAAGPDRIVASSPWDDFNGEGQVGSVHVFRRLAGGAWVYDERVVSSDGTGGDQYGYDLDLDGDRLAVACGFCDGPAGSFAGAAYPVLLLPRPSGSYCDSTINSSGFRAEVSIEGSLSVAADDLELLAGPVPQQFGIFFYGLAPEATPFGPGTLCVSAPRYRLPAQVAGLGLLRVPVDFTMPPAPEATIVAGSTWRFQAWFRDPVQAEGFQLSSALALTFQP